MSKKEPSLIVYGGFILTLPTNDQLYEKIFPDCCGRIDGYVMR